MRVLNDSAKSGNCFRALSMYEVEQQQVPTKHTTSQCGHQHESTRLGVRFSQNYLLVWIILIVIWGTTTSETLIMKIWGRCYDIQYEQQKLP